MGIVDDGKNRLEDDDDHGGVGSGVDRSDDAGCDRNYV